MRKTNFPVQMRWTAVASIALCAIAARHSFSDDDQGGGTDDWKAPSRAVRRKNPVPVNNRTLEAGKAAYAANCLACHGASGRGDGPAATTCGLQPDDLSQLQSTDETDGELFWKISQGKKPMPSFDSDVPETQRWEVVNYIRTLVPKPATQPANASIR
jgi:mono/diheme cytochrome c family protein